MNQRIAILTLEKSGDFRRGRSVLAYLLQIWERLGYSIEVHQGIKNAFEADVVISHLDLTVVPEEYTEFLRQFPSVINLNAKDISKRFISRNLVSEHDDYRGAVIVKTSDNYGGVPELLHREKLGESVNLAMIERPWRRVEWLDTYNYPVFDSIKDVPHGVWRNNKLVVEKFLPEIDEQGKYRLRYWLFLGDKELGTCHISSRRIVKETDENTVNIEGVPEALREARRQFGIDYGRIDYAMVDGEPVIYDINTTPATRDLFIELVGSRFEELASGIQYYLPKH
jgi:hypothetical protein